ncbi:MAG: Anaerobic dimethyl sulfoxide reductase chain [Verrucomicrobiota bacterium]
MPAAPAETAPDLSSYLAELLAEQQKLQTPVTRAATAHALQPSAWRAERFREIIPLSKPSPGEQYAFEVDLDSCSGCKACVSGCHSLNGLDEEETWRDIGVVYGLSALAAPTREAAPALAASHPFQQTVTTACHHCADPACLNGCPVLAYEKDPVTGIVRHLDDQCIGCSYCVLKCPYDVPKYNKRLGIVRKCDMCHGRLAEGEAPACVQACPTQAIRIVVVSAAVVPDARVAALSGTDSAYTLPSTRYVSKNPLPELLRAADADALRPQHAHLALVALLVCSQLSLGLLASAQLPGSKSQILSLTSAVFFAAGLGLSVFHLGQPLRAWRVFLGLKKSWLSREAVVLGAAFPLVALAAAQPWLPALFKLSPVAIPAAISPLLASGLWPLAAVFTTTLGVFCSAMIYIDTRRRFWRPVYSFGRMGGTALVAALAFFSPPFAAIALAAKLALEVSSLFGSSPSARLQRGPLLGHLVARLATGGLALLFFALGEPAFGFVGFVLGELLERALYFRAVDSPKMPGLSAASISCPTGSAH